MSTNPSPLPASSHFSFLPPQAIDHERSLLGTLLNVENYAYRVVDRLHEELFYKPANRNVFLSICEAVEQGGPVHLLTVLPHYQRISGREASDCRADLLSLTARDELTITDAYGDDTPAKSESDHRMIVESVIETLVERWQRRELTRLSGALQHGALDEDTDVGSTLSKLAENTERIAAGSRSAVRTSDHLDKMFTQGRERYELQRPTLGPPVFGIDRLDRVLDGAHPEGLIVVAGWTGSGKSALFNTILKNCTTLGEPCYSWSGELSEARQLHRLLAAETGLNSRLIARGAYYDHQQHPGAYDALDAAAEKISAAGHVFESGPMTLGRILTTISYHYRVSKVRVFLFDRKELFTVATKGGANTDEAVGEILSRIRALVSSLGGGCVFVASQVRKSHESNPGSRPSLADVIGAGAVTAAATGVVIVHRPEYYKIYEDEHGVSLKNVAILDVVKNSYGEVDETRVSFDPTVSIFTEYDVPDPDEQKAPHRPYGQLPISKTNTDEDIPF